MRKLLLCASAICFSMILFGQEESKKLKIKGANIQLGGSFDRSPVSNLSDFRKLAPNSTFQESDIIGFQSQHSSFEENGPVFSLNLVLAKPETEKGNSLNAEFRFGVSYQKTDLLNLSYGREEEFRVDTLISSRNGSQTFVDSIYTQDYYLTYTQHHVMLDADVTISTNPNRRFKFYGGVGLSLGLSVSPRTSIVYNETNRLEQQETRNSNFDSQFTISGYTEYFRNDGGFLGRVYLPLGIDFRIGKVKEYLTHYHLFFETRPSLTLQSVPELNLMTTTGNVSTIGLRYDF